jgi:hypothetical protein
LPVVAITAVLLAAPRADAAITFGQLDDFQGSTTLGWREGAGSPNPPAVVLNGGPGGAGDAFLQNVAIGGFGAGGRQVMFNQAQWAGDYMTAGVTRIEMKLRNLGQTTLSMRVALTSASSTRYGSTDAITLPAGSDWQIATFELSPSALTLLSGNDTVPQLLATVTEVRLLSAASGPSHLGDAIASAVGVDAIRALRLPGDANFDGATNFADLVVLAQHYNRVGGQAWRDGDFNFDGNVAFADLVLLAQNYNRTSAMAPVAVNAGDVGGAAFQHDWALARALVPEPSLALLSAGGLTAAAQRRRRRSRDG